MTGKCLLVSQGMLCSRRQACRVKHEEHINSFSHYTAPIVDGGIEYDVALTLEPGHRYAARRTGEGFKPWEEIDS